jgi:hypothetical protein
MAGKVFINYRRDDSPGTAGRLHDRLAQTFGRNNLFMDVDHIPAGVDFVEHLHGQVAACDVFLAVIGPNWLDAKDDDGRRRFDNPDDFVTIEIAAALARNIRVIPVLVDGARTPKADKLPESVKPLVRRNAVEVRNTQFGRDAEALANKVREALEGARPVTGRWQFLASVAPGRWRTVAGAVTALLLVGWIGLYQIGAPVWVPWAPDPPDKAKAVADAEAQRKATEAEQQRLKEEEQRQAQAAADAEAKRRAAEAEQLRVEEEEQRQAKAAADAEAKRKAAEAEQQRLAAIKDEEQRQAKAADVEAKLKAAEAEQQRLREEVQRQAKAAADAEAKRRTAEAEQQRLKDEEQRQAKAAADAEAKRKAAEAEQQRLAAIKEEEQRQAKAADAEAQRKATEAEQQRLKEEEQATAANLVSIAGNWSGQLTQVGANMSFKLELVIGPTGGQTKYPELDCIGTLARVGASKSYAFFVEIITKGAADKGGRCPDGTFTASRVGNRLALFWFAAGETYTAVAYGNLSKR